MLSVCFEITNFGYSIDYLLHGRQTKKEELPMGTLIVSCSKHITVVKDGVLHDTYDCSRNGTRCVNGYWTQGQIS